MGGQYYDSDDTTIKGGTDGTVIGNTGDKLKVDVGSSSVNVVSQDSAQFYCNANQLYSIGLDVSMATGSAVNPLVLFRNPTGSGKKIFIWRVQAGPTVTNVGAVFKLWHTPTVTSNGTTQTPAVRNINNSQGAAAALVNTLPTISANGTCMTSSSVGQNSNSIDLGGDFSICLQPNSALLITGEPSSNNRNATITIEWAEVSV